MKKQIRISISGQNTIVADFLVNRLLPNDQIIKVGPFVFLDHLYPKLHKGQTPEAYSGQNAHPHRGIATFSYVLSGELQHFDSRNHQGIVEEGGAQWMKAGSGIVHASVRAPGFSGREVFCTPYSSGSTSLPL
ncbi:pirin family protein [Arcticibacter sp. MXS-1]|uniref:pirin family protein n=1 Tax=Arcticibacter sp. MXS-1 TaxID=3341726 RepID=UPI0035A9369E